MEVVFVHVHVKVECIEAFRTASMLNLLGSRQEPGVLRFDLCQQLDDPSRFILYEAYRDQTAVAAHKETAHYKVWRDTVASMMAEPRLGVKYKGD